MVQFLSISTGLPPANRFTYRSQVLQRQMLALQGWRKLGSYLFSLLLALLTQRFFNR